MPTIQELTERYSQYTDEELMEIHEKIDEYSDEAKAALANVINAGGGIGALKDRIVKKIEIEREIRKIEFHVSELFNGNADIEYMKKHISYNLISDNRFNEIIEKTIDRLKLEKADKEIKLKTIIGGLTGGAIGGTLGGVLWGIQMIYTGHMYFIIAFGLAVLSYAFIKLFTRQSKKNIMVFVMTILSVIYALVLGQVLFEIFGYAG